MRHSRNLRRMRWPSFESKSKSQPIQVSLDFLTSCLISFLLLGTKLSSTTALQHNIYVSHAIANSRTLRYLHLLFLANHLAYHLNEARQGKRNYKYLHILCFLQKPCYSLFDNTFWLLFNFFREFQLQDNFFNRLCLFLSYEFMCSMSLYSSNFKYLKMTILHFKHRIHRLFKIDIRSMPT